MIAAKKNFGTLAKKYVYLSGWMVAATRSDFGPLPDQVSSVFGIQWNLVMVNSVLSPILFTNERFLLFSMLFML